MSAVVEGRRKGLFRRGSAAADASVDAPIAPEKGKKSGKKSGKRRGKEKPIGLPQVDLLPAEISDAIKAARSLRQPSSSSSSSSPGSPDCGGYRDQPSRRPKPPWRPRRRPSRT